MKNFLIILVTLCSVVVLIVFGTVFGVIEIGFPGSDKSLSDKTTAVGDNTNVKSFLAEFNTTVSSIKTEMGISNPNTTLYFQRVWIPTRKSDSCFAGPEAFTGEFLSSRREIVFQIPTFLLGSCYITYDCEQPENIMLVDEKKASDTMFFYIEHNHGYMSKSTSQTARPIACITPDGKILAMGEYFFSKEYLTCKIATFLNEITERYQYHTANLKAD